MSTLNVRAICQRWGQLTGAGANPDTQGLRLGMAGAPKYTTITPVEHKGPIVAKMDGAPYKQQFLQVTPVRRSLGVQVSVDQNGMEGVDQILRVPGPQGQRQGQDSSIVRDFDLDIGEAETNYRLEGDFKPVLEPASSGSQTCVRLREAEFTAEFSLAVTLSGSVAFNGWLSTQRFPIGHMVRLLKENDLDGSFRRFQVEGDAVKWTVSGRCRFYLTS